MSFHMFKIGLLNLENEDFVRKLVESVHADFQVNNLICTSKSKDKLIK